jgi:hypothetical protein
VERITSEYCLRSSRRTVLIGRFPEKSWPAPLIEAAPARPRSSPPKRLFGLMNDVAARKADIMQLTIGPLRELLSISHALPPNPDGLLDLGPESSAMIIYHLSG